MNLVYYCCNAFWSEFLHELCILDEFVRNNYYAYSLHVEDVPYDALKCSLGGKRNMFWNKATIKV